MVICSVKTKSLFLVLTSNNQTRRLIVISERNQRSGNPADRSRSNFKMGMFCSKFFFNISNEGIFFLCCIKVFNYSLSDKIMPSYFAFFELLEMFFSK